MSITLCEARQYHILGFAFSHGEAAKTAMIDNPEIIGERLQRLRLYEGLNQVRIAELLGIAQSAWSQYEKGSRRLTIDVAGQLVDRFGVTLDWLYMGDASGLPLRLSDLATTIHRHI